VHKGPVVRQGAKTAATVLLIAALMAGCGQPAGANAARPSPSATPRIPATPTSLSPVTDPCEPRDAPERPITIRAADGVRLAAATAGTGQRGVVLIPELGQAVMCGWWDYGAYLSRSGYRVLMFDHRCTGESACPAGAASQDLMADIRGATAWIRRAGAVTVVLVGASQGASEAVIAAARPPAGVTGIVALSADELTMPLARRPYPRTARAAAPRLRLPALFAVAVGDPNVSVTDTRRLVAAARSPDKHLVVLPASSGHGWDLVSLTPGTNTRPRFSHTAGVFLAQVTS
jgi:pimeloyl-ACP methyl ester carboxylesterase